MKLKGFTSFDPATMRPDAIAATKKVGSSRRDFLRSVDTEVL